MNTADYVGKYITELKNSGIPLSEVAWKTALACIGWPYIFGDRGEYCTPAHRRAAYASKGEGHPTIKSKCKNFDGSGSCSGCKYYPGGKTRGFDCRGFTYWVLLQVYGWKLMGAGCTSQWNNKDNWKAKGKISDGIPANTLVCLFYSKDNKEKTWEHTGFGFNNETVECSSGVQHFTSRNKKWTHWAVPACIDGQIPTPEPVPVDPSGETRPTLKRGSNGEYVKELQRLLTGRGYSVGSCGIDGDFGRATEAALKEFQRDCGLTADGICGPKTWAAFDGRSDTNLYTVHIPCMPLPKAQAIANQYPGAYLTAEGGE
jgi:hypothetical protein